jgi:hypothetical protein
MDSLSLASVFEEFRNKLHSDYGLDPAHYMTLPGFSNAAAFKMTKQQIELLTDSDMYGMIESSIRGGISSVFSKRYAKANNTYYDSGEKILKLSKTEAQDKNIYDP